MSTKNVTDPRGTNWNEDGIGILDGGIYIRCDDLTNLCVTRGFLLECVTQKYANEHEISKLKEELKYTQPSKFAPDMIQTLELRADECDKQKWTGQAMAYRDVACLLRKALPGYGR